MFLQVEPNGTLPVSGKAECGFSVDCLYVVGRPIPALDIRTCVPKTRLQPPAFFAGHRGTCRSASLVNTITESESGLSADQDERQPA